MIEVTVQYTYKGNRLIVNMGDWEFVPSIGDEIVFEGKVLLVMRRCWKVEMVAWERRQRVSLLCSVKSD